MNMMKGTLCALAILAAAATLSACSSKVAPTPAPTTAPTVTPASTTASPVPSPTQDAKSSAAAIALAEVTSLRVNAALVGANMLTMGIYGYNGTDQRVSAAFADMLATCAQQDSANPREVDLWPTPFKAVSSALTISCLNVETYEKNPATRSWTVVAGLMKTRLAPQLEAALTAVPDYSNAQWMRVIQERQ